MSYLSVGGRVLMVKKGQRENDPNSGFYTLPGGKLKDFEKGLISPRGRVYSAIRETKEETGINLINPRLRGVILFDNSERIFDNWPNPQDFLVHVFQARTCSGLLGMGGGEGIPVWVDESGLGSVPKNLGDELMYDWIKDGRFFTGVIRHKGRVLDEAGTFVDYF